ncbi:MAG: hypothetical protein HRT88_05700 [Lentisphaeraceae bacterium]|nr:hypothetical protein [Lentisphaeraceae bacterium]
MKSDKILTLLPSAFRQAVEGHRSYSALIELMEHYQQPAENVLEEMQRYFDIERAPDHFIPYLAHWLGRAWLLELDGILGEGPQRYTRMRTILLSDTLLSRTRGTEPGLLLLLRLATSINGFSFEEMEDKPFHMVLVCPAAAEHRRELIQAIVEHEKPAHLTFEIKDRENDDTTDICNH